MSPLAHIAGLPLEEALAPLLAGGGAGYAAFLWRGLVAGRRRRGAFRRRGAGRR